MPCGTYAKARSEVSAHLALQPVAACAIRVETRQEAKRWGYAGAGRGSIFSSPMHGLFASKYWLEIP